MYDITPFCMDECISFSCISHRLCHAFLYRRFSAFYHRHQQYLIRDEAQINRPVMGIISLENCTVQIIDRDKFIGWNDREFIYEMKNGTPSDARHTIEKLLAYTIKMLEGKAQKHYGYLCDGIFSISS